MNSVRHVKIGKSLTDISSKMISICILSTQLTPILHATSLNDIIFASGANRMILVIPHLRWIIDILLLKCTVSEISEQHCHIVLSNDEYFFAAKGNDFSTGDWNFVSLIVFSLAKADLTKSLGNSVDEVLAKE